MSSREMRIRRHALHSGYFRFGLVMHCTVSLMLQCEVICMNCFATSEHANALERLGCHVDLADVECP